MTVADVYSLTEAGLKDIEEEIEASRCSDLRYINELVSDLFKSGGKRIRSLLLLLITGLLGYTGSRTRAVGAIIEQVHTASLMHDDVVDSASTRRGIASTNSVYGNQIAVLAGDCLYTHAFLNLLKNYDTSVVSMIVAAANLMSQAEIMQMRRSSDLNITMREYLDIIFGKTAALFSATCACGALIAEPENDNRRDLLYSLGSNIGYAFQLQDDLMDYFGNIEVLGKVAGTDLSEKKVTLPMILLLKASENNPSDRYAIEKLFLSDNAEKLNELLDWFGRYHIRPQAETIIKNYINKAHEILIRFDASEYRDALAYLINSLEKSLTVSRELSAVMKERLMKT
jgi:octaprenyl-diphosphate synthase